MRSHSQILDAVNAIVLVGQDAVVRRGNALIGVI